ncbi:dihydrofolate reductase family protein [Cellulomonas sp. HZM]|uniref:dihydrofolate reductase family protein n=1 Tax=Cellulomonas sp. HZM TaxID=1454010 RepID=UPI000493128F|nr:dihydrofolate reductase family protein [Cellulomonas sp. HZM]
MTDSPALDVLLPTDRAGARIAPAAGEHELLDLLDADGPWVRANMISTLDGGATGPDHVTGSINGPADLRVFEALRTLADVVLVGAGTVRQERYGSLSLPAALAAERRARGRRETVELAVATLTGDVPDRLLASDRPPYVLTTPGCPALDELRARVGDDHVVVTGGPDGVDLPAALDVLAADGLTRVVTEGGPTLLSALVAADLLDELFLTWSPVVVGGPAPRVLDTAQWLRPVRELRPVHLLHADGVLLGRWTLRG